VDLRWIDPERRSEGLLQMFGALARGEGLVLVEDRPWSVLPAMQAHHPGEFDWYPLEEGPPVWRVLVARRWTRISSLHRMLEFMSSDHRRMELMLIHIRDLAERGLRDRAPRGAERNQDEEQQEDSPRPCLHGTSAVTENGRVTVARSMRQL